MAALLSYVSENGSGLVADGHRTGDGFRLGVWVSNRRSDFHAGRLSRERIEKLQSVPGWAWVARDNRWDTGLAALLAFAGENGHTCVPQRYVTAGGFRLGRWVGKRRNEYRRGTLSTDRITALEQLPGWRWRAAHRQTGGCTQRDGGSQITRSSKAQVTRHESRNGESTIPGTAA